MEFTVADKQAMFDTFNGSPSGGFVGIKGYESLTGFGEKANYLLQVGIDYKSIVAMSIKKLKQIMAGEIPELRELHVECQTWQGKDGSFSNRKSKDRTLITHHADYKYTDPDFERACADIMLSLTNPKKTDQPFVKEANGLYSVDGDTLYIRDCLVVDKKIVIYGKRPVSATEPYTALKREIKHFLPVANYRTFAVNGKFELITINHNEVKPE